jgi:hypothetical protein
MTDTDLEHVRRALGGPTVTPEVLVRALAHEDWRVRHDAVECVRRIHIDGEHVRALFAGLRDRENVSLRNASARALACLGSSVRPHVAAELPALDSDARKLALEVLYEAPDSASISTLLQWTADADTNVAVAAIEGLAFARESDPAALREASNHVLALLGQALPPERLAACCATLSEIGPPLPDPLFAKLYVESSLRALLLTAARGSTGAFAVAQAVAEVRARSSLASVALENLTELLRAGERELLVHAGVNAELGLLANTGANLALRAFCLEDSALSELCETAALRDTVLLDALQNYGAAALSPLLSRLRQDPSLDLTPGLLHLESSFDVRTLAQLCSVVSERISSALLDDVTEDLLHLLARVWRRLGGDDAVPLTAPAIAVLAEDATLDVLGRAVLTLVDASVPLRREVSRTPRLSPLQNLHEPGGALPCMHADDAFLREIGAKYAVIPEHLELLRVLALDEDPAVSDAATERLCTPEGVPVLESLAREHTRGVNQRRFLRALGKVAPAKVLELAPTASYGVGELYAIVEVLAPLSSAHAVLIQRGLATGDPELITAMLRHTSPTALSPEIIALMDHPEVAVQRQAAHLLAHESAHRESVRARLARMPSAHERGAIREALMLPKLREHR